MGIILVIVLIILAFLFIPFHLNLGLSNKEKSYHGNFRVRWIGITIYKSPIPPKKKKEKKEKKVKPKKEKWDMERIQKVIKLIYEALPHLERILYSFLRSIKLEDLSISLNFGMESPADTAIITGYIWAFIASTKYLLPMNISVTPNFDKRVIEGSLDLKLRITLVRITLELLRAITKKPVRSLVNEMRG
jgi:hypothetical protein